MDEPVLVRKRESARDLDARSRAPRARRGALANDALLQVLAVDVLEDDVLPVVLLAAVDDRDDVRVLQLGDRTRLALESLDEVLVAVVLLVEDLERDVPLE